MSDEHADQATWVWSDAHGGGRNVFAWFRRRLDLAAVPATAVLHLFADARWRLRVDGVVVAYGPCRFVPGHPEFDSIDLRPWLHAGCNLLLVEVWSPGCSTFQTMPESSGGFIAWGTVGAHDLATPGAWQVQRSVAWDATAPAYSFAQGPVEILDLARLPPGGWSPDTEAGWLAPVARIDRPWGLLQPRSLPALGTGQIRPVSLSLVAALDAGEVRWSCRCQRPAGGVGRQRFPYALAISSPRAQRLSLGLFWGPHWLNGAELAMVTDPQLGNRQNATVELRAGDNLLYGEPEALRESWAHYVALPAAADVTCGPLRIGLVLGEAELAMRRGAVPLCEADLKRLAVDWHEVRPAAAGAIPARDMAWDRPGRPIAADALPLRFDAACDPAGWVVVADFGGEFLGHVRVEIEAPAGTVVDVASDERRRADGQLGFYATNHSIDGADRVVLSGGRQQVELFHPRGGRWVQLAIRPAFGVGSGVVVVHDLALRSHQVPVARDGTFACSDPVFDWTWDAAHRTLQACVEDAFIDCPWRERGTYLGDALVEAATLAAFERNPAVARRCLSLWAQGQLPDGQMQDSVPSWHRHPLPDFSLIWILLLHQMWSRDGDLADATRWWAVVPRILASPGYKAGPGGLWEGGAGLFIDWGVEPADRTGEANACLNAFRLRALACAVELATALGRSAEAAAFSAERATLLSEFRRRLWLPEAGCFARRTCEGRPDPEGSAAHANALVLAFALADPAQEPGVLAHLEGVLASNAQRTIEGGTGSHLELYFLSYALEGLYRCGRPAVAEQVMRQHWGAMETRGAWTMWESLRRGAEGSGSLCHAWSTTPARWFHERVLGVRPVRPGDPSLMLVAPDSALDWAEGDVPHPAGLVHVAWKRRDGRIEITATAPPGVQLRIA